MCYDGAARMLGDGKLEVTYKKSDEEDIYVNPMKFWIMIG